MQRYCGITWWTCPVSILYEGHLPGLDVYLWHPLILTQVSAKLLLYYIALSPSRFTHSTVVCSFHHYNNPTHQYDILYSPILYSYPPIWSPYPPVWYPPFTSVISPIHQYDISYPPVWYPIPTSVIFSSTSMISHNHQCNILIHQYDIPYPPM